MLLRITKVCCFAKFYFTFKRFFFLQINSGISCTAEVKVNKGFLRVKMLLSIVNLTCKRFAKNLGSKVTDDRCGSFPSSERSRCQIFWNMFCPELLQRYWLFVKNFAIFCSQLAL